MTSLRRDWAALTDRLKILEPIPFSPDGWTLLERLHATFNDRQAHARLPMPIARFRSDAVKDIYACAATVDEVRTAATGEGSGDAVGDYARRYDEDVDVMVGVLFPTARFRKGHYAYGRFTVPTPHGVHTDHSAEDPAAAGEPICIARIETLGTHYITGDYRTHDSSMQSMLMALRHWVTVPEGEPEAVFEQLLKRNVLRTIPVNHVMLMVAGNGSADTQVTQHIAARPPAGGQHSAFFQRQYKLE